MALVRAAALKQEDTINLTAAVTGLRLGELLAQRWRGVDFTNSAIHVRQSFTNGEALGQELGQLPPRISPAVCMSSAPKLGQAIRRKPVPGTGRGGSRATARETA